MQDALAGHETAYRLLLQDVSRALRGVVRNALARAGRGNADAEDVLQEILLAIHTKRDTWDRNQPLRPWINAITRYKLIDCLRRQGVRAGVPIDDVSETLACPPEDNTDTRDVRKLLDLLPERDRVIVQGISLDGRSIAETALSVDMQEGAVRVALHRALKKLGGLYRQREP
jgi:RNA polymerase sigma-70 factor (ECF subfamily)